MNRVSWGTTLQIAGQAVAMLGVAGAATQYITKSAIHLYNKICPGAWKMEDKTAEKVSGVTSAIVSLIAGIGLFSHKMFHQQYGKSDDMRTGLGPEAYQEYLDKEFLKNINRLLPHLMPENFRVVFRPIDGITEH